MITVCLASYNGEKYIAEQLESILIQLGVYDSLIVSDDGSTDSTLDIINSFNDKRIILIKNEIKPVDVFHSFQYVTSNFNNAIKYARGDYIFFSDQDDIWLPNKISDVIKCFGFSDIVLSNCEYIDQDCKFIGGSKFKLRNPSVNPIVNFMSNNYQGSTLAIKKEVLQYICPIPTNVPHDMWIGIVGSFKYIVCLNYRSNMLYRRHPSTVTTQQQGSNNASNKFKLFYRFVFIAELIKFYILKLSHKI